MKMTITVEMASGESIDVDVQPVTQVAFEREFKIPLASLGDDPRMEYSYWLAWHASQRGRPNAPTFDAWLETVDGLSSGAESDAEDDADPLAATAPSGGSLPSPSNPAQA